MTECPNCKEALKQEDAVVCIECGYHLVEGKLIGASAQPVDSVNPYEAPEADTLSPDQGSWHRFLGNGLHLFAAFVATIVGMFLFTILNGYVLTPVMETASGGTEYFPRSIFAAELFVPAFFFGAIFSDKSFPMCGVVGMIPAYLLSLLLMADDDTISLSLHGLIFVVVLTMIFPAMSEQCGRIVGRFFRKNVL